MMHQPREAAMKMMLAALLLVAATPALADPAAAGKCSLIDDGTARMITPNTARFDPAKPAGPHILSMALPRDFSRYQNAIFDIAFGIKKDGSITAPKILCSAAAGADLEKELLKAAVNWRFAPLAGPVNVSYRIVAATGGRIPLGVMADRQGGVVPID
jgi:hypothetical protein